MERNIKPWHKEGRNYLVVNSGTLDRVRLSIKVFGDHLTIRPSQKIKKLSDQKYLLTTFIVSNETLKNAN